MKREFTGNCVPTASPLGKILINCRESREISKSIREMKHGDVITIKLSDETIERINDLKLRKKK